MVAELLEGQNAGKVAVGVTQAAEARPHLHRQGREGRSEVLHFTLAHSTAASAPFVS